MLMNPSLASSTTAKTISDWFERVVSQMCPECVNQDTDYESLE